MSARRNTVSLGGTVAAVEDLCNVSDIVAVNTDLFSPTSDTICARQPVPGP